MKKLVAYIRGGLGDIWLAISAIKPIIEKEQISKFDITLITDNIYYFKDYPRGFEKFSLDALNKLSSNIIMVPPWKNNRFKIDVNDVTDELSQENADKNKKEFMFWRPNSLKEFVKKYFTENTIFIDAPFSECIMRWDFEKEEYERVGKERAVFTFIPTNHEDMMINRGIKNSPKHVLIHIRKKTEGNSYTETNTFYNSIIEYCNLNKIIPIVIGVDFLDLRGLFVDYRGDNILSFDGICYLIDRCNIMVGNDSAFSHIKLYQQQKDKLLIMNHARFERSPWVKNMLDKSNCIILDAKKENTNEVIKLIGDYYEDK